MASPQWYDGVKKVFDSWGVPEPVWLGIMYGETRTGDPNAHNQTESEDSWGLFQLNREGGQGQGYDPSVLVNPVVNASIAAPSIAAAYKEYGNNIAQVAAHSGHPGFSDSLVNDPRVVVIKDAFWRAQQAATQTADGLWGAVFGGTSPTDPGGTTTPKGDNPATPPVITGGGGGINFQFPGGSFQALFPDIGAAMKQAVSQWLAGVQALPTLALAQVSAWASQTWQTSGQSSAIKLGVVLLGLTLIGAGAIGLAMEFTDNPTVDRQVRKGIKYGATAVKAAAV